MTYTTDVPWVFENTDGNIMANFSDPSTDYQNSTVRVTVTNSKAANIEYITVID